MKSGNLLKEFVGHTGFVNDVVFSSDGRHVLSGSADGSVRIWSTRTAECVSNCKAGALITVGSLSFIRASVALTNKSVCLLLFFANGCVVLPFLFSVPNWGMIALLLNRIGPCRRKRLTVYFLEGVISKVHQA